MLSQIFVNRNVAIKFLRVFTVEDRQVLECVYQNANTTDYRNGIHGV